jgi:hypothetical protein
MSRTLSTAGLATLILGGVLVLVAVRFRAVERAKAEQAEACRALVHSEVVIWNLEGACLKDALRILAQPEARKIAETAGVSRDPRRVEARLRQYLRLRRPPELWEETEQAFVTFTPDSRAATTEVAMQASLRPVDIMAEWLTFEGAVDLYLMEKLYSDRQSLPPSVKPVADTFFEPGAPPPGGERGVRIVSTRDDGIVIDLFGAKVSEEWVRCRPLEIMAAGQAKVPWKSNYNYFRDAIRGLTPEDVPDFTLVRSDEGFGVDYRSWIAEYRAGGDSHPWATVMCLKGPRAVGAIYEELEKESAEKEKAAKSPGEKAPGHDAREKPDEKAK